VAIGRRIHCDTGWLNGCGEVPSPALWLLCPPFDGACRTEPTSSRSTTSQLNQAATSPARAHRANQDTGARVRCVCAAAQAPQWACRHAPRGRLPLSRARVSGLEIPRAGPLPSRDAVSRAVATGSAPPARSIACCTSASIMPYVQVRQAGMLSPIVHYAHRLARTCARGSANGYQPRSLNPSRSRLLAGRPRVTARQQGRRAPHPFKARACQRDH
jgi:hypothetical protein